MEQTFYENLHKSEVTPYRISCAKQMTGQVLDVGGGLGSYLPYFDGEATVIDISEEALDRLDYDKKMVADALDLPFKDSSFDCIWACAVCQYFDLNKFITEATRVIKNCGRIMILVPNKNSIWDVPKKWIGMDTWANQIGIYKQYSVRDLKRFGKVKGEIRFLPFENLFRHLPFLGHTLMLEIIVHKS